MKKKLLLIISSCLILITTIVGGTYWYTRQVATVETMNSISDKTWKLVSHGKLGSEQQIIEGTVVTLTFYNKKSSLNDDFYVLEIKVFDNIYSYKYVLSDRSNIAININVVQPIGITTQEPNLSEQQQIAKSIIDKHRIVFTDSTLQLINTNGYSLIFELQE